jgi:hypothetical protein
MVWINYQHHNYSVPKGTFGGAICLCPECVLKGKTTTRKDSGMMTTYTMVMDIDVSDMLSVGKAFGKVYDALEDVSGSVLYCKTGDLRNSQPEAKPEEVLEEQSLNETGFTMGKPSQTTEPKQTWIPEDVPTREAVGVYCRFCENFFEPPGVTVGEVIDFYCPKCDMKESWPTVTTKRVPV